VTQQSFYRINVPTCPTQVVIMKTVSARQANHEFSDLLSRAERGEEILITKRSKPVAVLGPYRPPLMAAERKRPFNVQLM
jgi:prevent-host-death family protein